MCCTVGLDLPPSSALSYIYLHRHHKRLWLLPGHSGKGQYYFCCVDHSAVTHLPAGLLGYQALSGVCPSFPLKFGVWGILCGVSGPCSAGIRCDKLVLNCCICLSKHAEIVPDGLNLISCLGSWCCRFHDDENTMHSLFFCFFLIK